jgi:hypothetical protein
MFIDVCTDMSLTPALPRLAIFNVMLFTSSIVKVFGVTSRAMSGLDG